MFAGFLRFSERAFAPIVELLVRLYVAQLFWVSGVIKITNWDNALFLSSNEYPVDWLDPVAAAYIGVFIEFFGSLLLVFGFATRFAATSMIMLTVVSHFEYQALEVNYLIVVILGWFVFRGAGVISVDNLTANGFREAPLPLVKPLAASFSVMSKSLFPFYQLLVRAFLGVTLIYGLGQFDFDSANINDNLVVVGVALFIVIGLVTRISCLVAAILLCIPSFSGHELSEVVVMNLIFIMSFLVFSGSGAFAVDQILEGIFCLRRRGKLKGKELPHVVVIGAGFGGVTLARELSDAMCRVTLIDRHNYHLFQPLLYQVATAALSPADIATPIRSLFKGQDNVSVLMGEVTGINKVKYQVNTKDRTIKYDYLVLATGARHSYFGKDEWEEFSPGLKRIEDATNIRRRILLAFEKAENTVDKELQQKLMTFVIVGAGPTGVELAGAIAELAHHGMSDEFNNIDPADAKVYLVQAGDRVLPAFSEKSSSFTQESLESLGVTVLLDQRVEDIDADGAVVGGRKILSDNVFWAAGVAASPAGQWLGAETDRAGRIKVNKDLSVPGYGNIYAIGDTAYAEVWDGKPMPGVAPAAKQSGKYVARRIAAIVSGKKHERDFVYKHQGNLATIGRKYAVADFNKLSLKGAIAWWLWSVVHVMFLSGTRNRISVALEWAWSYLTYGRGTRLITDEK